MATAQTISAVGLILYNFSDFDFHDFYAFLRYDDCGCYSAISAAACVTSGPGAIVGTSTAPSGAGLAFLPFPGGGGW
jgi:hypothetical protein